MELTEKIQAAIAENLPNAHAGELKKFIDQAQKDSIELKALREKATKDDRELTTLRGHIQTEKDIEAIKNEQDTKAVELDNREKILEIREYHAKERVSEIRGLTETVFKSNRLNYDVSVGIPVNPPPKDQYGNRDYSEAPDTHMVTGNVTKED